MQVKAFHVLKKADAKIGEISHSQYIQMSVLKMAVIVIISVIETVDLTVVLETVK